MNIQQTQDALVEEFGLLDGDQEMTLVYLMELGQKLAPFPESSRTDDHLIKGCQSRVWLDAEQQEDKVVFYADSNTAITKGLVSLLLRVFSGRTPDEILGAQLTFPSRIGMERFIGTQRTNGFSAMLQQIRYYAMAFKTKQTTGA